MYFIPEYFFVAQAKDGSWELFEQECADWPGAAVAVSARASLRILPLTGHYPPGVKPG